MKPADKLPAQTKLPTPTNPTHIWCSRKTCVVAWMQNWSISEKTNTAFVESKKKQKTPFSVDFRNNKFSLETIRSTFDNH